MFFSASQIVTVLSGYQQGCVSSTVYQYLCNAQLFELIGIGSRHRAQVYDLRNALSLAATDLSKMIIQPYTVSSPLHALSSQDHYHMCILMKEVSQCI